MGPDRFAAIVRDVSPDGLFVQTRARLEPNSLVELVFPASENRPEIRSEAGVAGLRVVPPRLQRSVEGGVGLELLNPPAALRELLAGDGDPETSEVSSPESPAAEEIRTFRIRLVKRGTPKARVLTIRAQTASGARARALTQMGPGWKIGELQEV